MGNEDKGSGGMVLAFLSIWISFAVFSYPLLMTYQQSIMMAPVDADRQLIESFIGWELRRQTMWAALTVSCFVGVFSLARLVKDYRSAYVRFLLILMYVGFALALEYCLLKLFWSYQLIRKYEVALGTSSEIADPIQNFLFLQGGAMSTRGSIIITSLLGLAEAMLFQIPQLSSFDKAAKREKRDLMEEERTLLEEDIGTASEMNEPESEEPEAQLDSQLGES